MKSYQPKALNGLKAYIRETIKISTFQVENQVKESDNAEIMYTLILTETSVRIRVYSIYRLL